jgi:hypothetical protein
LYFILTHYGLIEQSEALPGEQGEQGEQGEHGEQGEQGVIIN